MMTVITTAKTPRFIGFSASDAAKIPVFIGVFEFDYEFDVKIAPFWCMAYSKSLL
jgi:hypothetical protein